MIHPRLAQSAFQPTQIAPPQQIKKIRSVPFLAQGEKKTRTFGGGKQTQRFVGARQNSNF
jgi:hypothetical protein